MSVKSVVCYDNAYLFDNKTCLLQCPSRKKIKTIFYFLNCFFT